MVCDGFKSKLRKDVTNSDDKGGTNAFILKMRLKGLVHRYFLYREIRFGLPFGGQSIIETLDEDMCSLQVLCQDKPPDDVSHFLESIVAPTLPGKMMNIK